MNVKDRLIKFIEYKNLNKNKFEKTCGLSTGYIGNMRVSIQPDKIKSIATNFPELNTGWLLTGEGEMLKPTPLDNLLPKSDSTKSEELSKERLFAIIESQQRTIENLSKKLLE